MREPSSNAVRIGYSPFSDTENAYVERNKEILSRLGSVHELPRLRKIVVHPLQHLGARLDVAVINWWDNELVSEKTGKLSLPGLFGFLLKSGVIRLLTRKVIFVRHNNYPHHANRQAGPRIARLLDRLEALFSVSVTHSGHNTMARRLYAPHPLYRTSGGKDAAVIPEPQGDYYVAFGRIQSYKKLEDLAENFPPNKRLIIAGPCQDSKYLRRIAAAAHGKNIEIHAGYLAREEAERLVANAIGMVISHAEADMVASGSYFFALSLGVPVYAIRTPFFQWSENTFGPCGLHLYDSLELLRQGIETTDGHSSREAIISYAARAFGDPMVAEHWRKVLDSIGIAA